MQFNIAHKFILQINFAFCQEKLYFNELFIVLKIHRQGLCQNLGVKFKLLSLNIFQPTLMNLKYVKFNIKPDFKFDKGD